MASRMWRRPWSCLANSSTTKCSCSPSSEHWKCSALSPWGTAATWLHLSWQPCRGDWSTPPMSLNTCCQTSSTATWRARTTPNYCSAGKPVALKVALQKALFTIHFGKCLCVMFINKGFRLCPKCYVKCFSFCAISHFGILRVILFSWTSLWKL